MKKTRLSRAAYDNQQPRNEQLPLQPLPRRPTPRGAIEFPYLFAISPAFHGTETWCLLHRRDLGEIKKAK